MNNNLYRIEAKKVYSYELTVSASTPIEAISKAIDGNVECSDLLDVELKTGECKEVEQ
jgi:hypothetical protein